MSAMLLAALLLVPLAHVPVALAAPGVTVTPTSGLVTTETGGTATFSVVLVEQPAANVTIGLSSNDTTEGTVSVASVTFTSANWNTPQIVTVTGVDDAVDDGNVAYTIVTANATSADPGYNNLTVANVTASNQDNDTVGVTVSGVNRNTTEAGGTATFTVVLNSQPTASVSIPVSSDDTSEGTVSPTTLTFTTANWSTPQTVTITGVGDTTNDGDQQYTIILSFANSSDNDYDNINPNNVTLYNLDDDGAGIIVSNISANTTEAGPGTATFTVRLATAPSSSVTIGLTSNDLTEGTISASSLIFTTVNWATDQTVTVTGVNDNVDDGNIAYTIVTAQASGGGANYNNLNAADIPVINVDDDTAGFTVTPVSGLTTTEAGGQATFTVRLSSQPSQNVAFSLSSNDTTEGTVSPTTLTFTGGAGGNWNTDQTVTISGVDDNVDDGDIAYTIVTGPATSTDAQYTNLNPPNVTVTNQDNDTAGINVPPSGGTTTETGGTTSFTIVLASQPTADVTIPLSSSDTTEGTVSPASLTFTSANWDTSQNVVVTGVNDDVDDDEFTYTIVTSPASSADPNYNNRDAGDISIVNHDDDVAGVTITTSGNTTEAGGTTSFTVVLNSQPTSNVVIGLSSSNTAEGTVSPAALTLTVDDWDVPQTVTVTGVDDAVDDDDVEYTIVTANATSSDAKYNEMVVDDVSLFNIDNDGAGTIVGTLSGDTTEAGNTATFTVRLATQPTADVTFSLSSNDTTEGTVSPASLTFTSANWNQARTVTVTGVDDDVDDGDIDYAINFAPATSADAKYTGMNVADVPATNTDDDTAGFTVSAISGDTTEAGGTATFTIRLTSEPTADVTIGLNSSDSVEGLPSPTSVTFDATDWETPKTVTVTGGDDNFDDGNASYTIVTAPASSGDLVYDSLNPADVDVTNVDDDVAGISVVGNNLTTTETGGSASFTVVLNSQPTADVTIAFNSSDTTEGTVSPATLTFISAEWNTPQLVTITGVNDDVDDGDIDYTIVTAAATSSDNNYDSRAVADVSVVNTDDDTAGFTVSSISGNTTEAGGTATFTINLNSQPTAAVTITLSSSNTAEGTVAPSELVFTSSDWQTPQTVTITGVDELVDDGDAAYTIVTAPTDSTDTTYNGLDADDRNLFNIDNDGAGVVVSALSGDTTEAGGTATFTVTLATQPTAVVTITLSTDNPAEGSVSPASLVYNNANWNTAQTVTVAGVNDLVDDGDIAYNIVLAPASSTDAAYNGQDAADLSALNIDDDVAGIAVSAISGNTTEVGGTATFTMALESQPTAAVTIALSSSDISEGTVSPASLTFTTANWNTPRSVTVTGVNDLVDDNNIAYTIITAPASSADPNYDLLNVGDVGVSNTDDDTAGVAVSAISRHTTEAGATATFTVRLNSQPEANVSLTLSSSDLTEGAVAPTLLIFDSTNWNTPQTVTVTGVDDSAVDGNITYTIVTGPASSADSAYNGRAIADVTVVNDDNDIVSVPEKTFLYLPFVKR
jgi:large repetitive protein